MDGAVQSRDKVQLYLDARYVSSIEAYARSMGWPTHRVRICFNRQQTQALRIYRSTLQ
jgi:hypothetical protein